MSWKSVDPGIIHVERVCFYSKKRQKDKKTSLIVVVWSVLLFFLHLAVAEDEKCACIMEQVKILSAPAARVLEAG